MNKNQKTVEQLLMEREQLLQKREAENVSMNAIADKAAANKREMSAEENVEYQQHKSAFDRLGREIALNAQQADFLKAKPREQVNANALLREALKSPVSREYVISREAINTASIEEGGLIPLNIQDILPPLEMGLIWDKVGVPVQTGVVGDLQWPVMGAVEASVAGEGVELADTTIDWGKVVAKKVRVGIAIRVSNQAINNTNTDLLALIKEQAKQGYIRLLNRVLFSHENFTSDFHGPFAGAKAQITFEGAVPTLAELMKIKGAVASEGINMAKFSFVMDEAMKATLEATPQDAGSGLMIVENGKIKGYPVYCTEYINYGSDKTKSTKQYIGAGVWDFEAVNQYGALRMTVDPYTRAKFDEVVITLNSDWSLTTLRKEAFALAVNA